MIIFLCALGLQLFTNNAFAQNPGLVANVYGRKTTSLNGAWRAIVDPYENGYYNYRYQPRTDGFFINQKPQSKSDLIEYDFDTAGLLQVPGDWNSQRLELFFYEGTIWYKKDFDYKKQNGTRIFVHFGAANYDAKVYLNGKKLGEHEGGFTPFNFEITNVVQEKNNFLIVKVDNQRRRDAVPTVNTDWWNYGGLTREVLLVEVPETFIQDYFIQLEKGSRKRVAGWIQLNGSRRVQSVTIGIPEAKAKTIVTTDENGYAEFNFAANLKYWSPENPKLYDVVVEAETDRVTEAIGFRTITTKGTDILLNGQPIFLRGICIHEQAPIREGRAFSVEDARTLLGWAKELGANFVRLAHYPHNEHVTRLADSMGLLVWSEIPVYWTILWENEATLRNAKTQLAEMIARDKNKASVIIWSMGNETPLSEARLHFMVELTKLARSLDSTRLLTAALERHYFDPKTQMIDDPLGAHLDVIGCNEYLGWYDGLPDKADGMSWKTVYDKPLIISEFGAGALQGYHGDELTRWTEEYQASVYRHQIAMLKRIPFLRGVTPWILTDFRSPRRPLSNFQDYWNRKGLISNRGVKKAAFYILQKFYEDMKKTY
ncbi:MAG: beta galactosidase jelly roll domain-containing protein [candidate division KSB1 bacterium]|nr:beta galactosidase jelly roll domain-containing protein [candidate division KSB1 bacterium]MDZ7303657.1 beta galactosidase jelly roll domain-containing protein [candidate division KSB1 bacterium]MDZ7313323.1 beta galactosidase jelly roll domain-containing protein [candidate division KSB1 bacterium]